MEECCIATLSSSAYRSAFIDSVLNGRSVRPGREAGPPRASRCAGIFTAALPERELPEAPSSTQQGQQQMLGLNAGPCDFARLVTGKEDDAPRLLRVALEHAENLYLVCTSRPGLL